MGKSEGEAGPETNTTQILTLPRKLDCLASTKLFQDDCLLELLHQIISSNARVFTRFQAKAGTKALKTVAKPYAVQIAVNINPGAVG